ncbi:ATP-dependent zinc metalloprotease FtsH [Acholeplasma sp. OttesenSCG-928-E16]|nr:ATP-dependent zinc metalloprotease FtsH [Acholeplasma sp. OttesenSCG-928-E16]
MIVIIGSIFFFTNAFQTPKLEVTEESLMYQIKDNNIAYIEFEPAGGTNVDTWIFVAEVRQRLDADGNKIGGNSGYTLITGAIYNGIVDGTTTLKIIQTELGKFANTEFKIKVVSDFDWLGLIFTIVPIIFMVIMIVVLFKSLSGAGGNKQAFDFGKSRARLSKNKEVTFKDVAGCDEEKEELEEIIDFLKNPKKYADMGAKIPKGVLLVGSPGTGKTLLAKAVSGEASVPFFSISGSDFVEMFVGVGASRVRDLFKVAKENSPCIIFIDEIDAVGRQRGAGLGGGHDEREQTLNQLLVEMDGFSTNLGIIIMAATNRPDVLDPALLRPGRFDRQITIDLPDVIGREAILKVHARNKRLDKNIRFDHVAQRIPGFSGADIANLLNEAALLAARDNRSSITEKDIDEAVDRVMMGPAKKSRKYTPEEKKTVAYHEAGHSVIGLKLKDARVVQKVTIIPRGRAGGYNLMTPAQETYLSTKESLLAEITSFLGGRVAEEIVFNTVTTGAYGDFQSATHIARAMVTEYGMSDLGPIQYESSGGNVFLGRDYFKEKNFSDQVALEIDKEVRHIITDCYEEARKIITEHRDLLDRIAYYLLEVETLNKADIQEIMETGILKWWEDTKATKNRAVNEAASAA